MPLRVPSFPVPGEHGRRKREADEAEPEEDETQEQQESQEAGEEEVAGIEAAEGGDDASDDVPEMLELVDHIEEARTAVVEASPAAADGSTEAVAAAVSAFANVLRTLGRRLRLSPGDRDMLSDFEGVDHICAAMASPAISWRGEAMHMLCKALPDICRTSTINRGAFRDAGGVDAMVDFLCDSVATGDEPGTVAASVGLVALCTANDGNKKTAARLKGEFNEDELVESNADYRTPLFKDHEKASGLDVLLKALERFPQSVPVQTQACAALRTLLSDDDSRQASCVPSAVENRERAVNEKHFPEYRAAVVRALVLEASGKQLLRLREQAMLLLRELSCRQDRIHELVFEARLLPGIEASLRDGDERVVRASLAVIRAFAFSDELKEKLAVESDVALRAVAAVRRHVENAPICEQGFGLFANLTMRKPHIATRLNNQDYRVFAVGQLVLARHKERPGVVKSILQTLRNVATQDDAAALEVKESDLLEEMRELVVKHEGDGKWRSPVEIAKQFLREFRADEGIRKAAEFNDYY